MLNLRAINTLATLHRLVALGAARKGELILSGAENESLT